MQIEHLKVEGPSRIECLRIKSMTLFAPKYLLYDLYDMPHLAEDCRRTDTLSKNLNLHCLLRKHLSMNLICHTMTAIISSFLFLMV